MLPQAATLSDYHSAPNFWRPSSVCFTGRGRHTSGRQNVMSKVRPCGYPSSTCWQQSLWLLSNGTGTVW